MPFWKADQFQVNGEMGQFLKSEQNFCSTVPVGLLIGIPHKFVRRVGLQKLPSLGLLLQRMGYKCTTYFLMIKIAGQEKIISFR